VTVYLVVQQYDATNLFRRIPPILHATVTTQADGTFLFPSTPTVGNLHLFARHPEKGVAVRAMGENTPKGSGTSLPPLRLHPTTTIYGKVLKTDNKPLSEVQVTLQNIEFNEHLMMFASEISYHYCPLPPELQALWNIKTAPDGTYTITGVPDGGSVSMVLSKSGYNNRDGHFYFNNEVKSGLTPDKPFSLSLPRLTQIRGKVTTNNPSITRLPTGWFLDVSSELGRESVPVSEDGTFELKSAPPGKTTLQLISLRMDSPIQLQLEQILPLQEGTEKTDLVLTAQAVPSVKVTGKVVDAVTGKGIPNFWLNVSSGSGLSTDANGEYTFFTKPGPVSVIIYSFGARTDNYVLSAIQPISASGTAVSGTPLTLDPIRLKPSKKITVRVVDPAGKPQPDAVVVDSLNDHIPLCPPTNADGETYLYGLDPDSKDTLSLIARAGEAFSPITPFEIAKLQDTLILTVQPKKTVRLTAILRNDAGKPLPNTKLRIVAAQENSSRYLYVTTDSQGVLNATTPLPPNYTYSLEIELPLYESFTSPKWVGKDGGTHDFGVLTLTRLRGVVSGVVVDSAGKPVAGATVFNTNGGAKPVVTKTDTKGRFQLMGMTLGTHYIGVEKTGQPVAVLRTKVPKEAVRIVLKPLLPGARPTTAETTTQEQYAFAQMDIVLKESRKKPEDFSKRQRIIDILYPRLPGRAAAIANDGGNAEKDSLNVQLAKTALRTGSVAGAEQAVFLLKQIGSPYWRIRPMLLLSDGLPPAQAKVLLTAAQEALADLEEKQFKPQFEAHLGARMWRNQIPGGEDLMRQAAESAQKAKPNEEFLRSYVARPIAEWNLSLALELLKSIKEDHWRQMAFGEIALSLVDRNPDKTIELVEQNINSGFSTSPFVFADIAARLARKYPNRAEQILAKIKPSSTREADRNFQYILAHLWIAERLTDRTRSLEMMARADKELTLWAKESLLHESVYTDWTPSTLLAYAASIGKKLGYRGTPTLIIKSIAYQPNDKSPYLKQQPLRVLRAEAERAFLLAATDPKMAREYILSLFPRMQSVEETSEADQNEESLTYERRTIRRFYLMALALTDLRQTEAYIQFLESRKIEIDRVAIAEALLREDKRQEFILDAINESNPDRNDL
jgi:hypothetical protein